MEIYKVLVITESQNHDVFKKKIIDLLSEKKYIHKLDQEKSEIDTFCGFVDKEISYNVDFNFINPSKGISDSTGSKLYQVKKVIIHLTYDYSEDKYDSLMDLITHLIDTRKVFFKVYPLFGESTRFELSLIVSIKLNENDIGNVLAVSTAKMNVVKWISAVFNIEKILLSDFVSKFKNSVCVLKKSEEDDFGWLKGEYLIID